MLLTERDIAGDVQYANFVRIKTFIKILPWSYSFLMQGCWHGQPGLFALHTFITTHRLLQLVYHKLNMFRILDRHVLFYIWEGTVKSLFMVGRASAEQFFMAQFVPQKSCQTEMLWTALRMFSLDLCHILKPELSMPSVSIFVSSRNTRDSREALISRLIY